MEPEFDPENAPIDVNILCDALHGAPLYHRGRLTRATPFNPDSPDTIVSLIYLGKDSKSSERALVALGKQIMNMAASGRSMVGLVVPVSFRYRQPAVGAAAGVTAELWDSTPEFLRWCKSDDTEVFFFIPPDDRRMGMALPSEEDACAAARFRKPNYSEIGGTEAEDSDALPPLTLAISGATRQFVSPLVCANQFPVPEMSPVKAVLLAGPSLFIPREQRAVRPAELFDTGVYQDKLLMFVFVSQATIGRTFEEFRRKLEKARRDWGDYNGCVVMCPCDVIESGHDAVATAWNESPVLAFQEGAKQVRALAAALAVTSFPSLAQVSANRGTLSYPVERLYGADHQYSIHEPPPLSVAGTETAAPGPGKKHGTRKGVLFCLAALGTAGLALFVALRLGKLQPIRRQIMRLKRAHRQ